MYYNTVSTAYISVTVKCIKLHKSFIILYSYFLMQELHISHIKLFPENDDEILRHELSEKKNHHSDVVCVCVNLNDLCI